MITAKSETDTLTTVFNPGCPSNDVARTSDLPVTAEKKWPFVQGGKRRKRDPAVKRDGKTRGELVPRRLISRKYRVIDGATG
ncbi:hypothetical protein K0M31_005029 [Melipona bicolor]|uniref:Uncharacterized protein n=1 Tax=Melipona bicolor TaxID=60889 RepID=A0AA40FW71_9HYME|nr:hypothetical protein K0M31_005029 [Melipona bicolor]